MAKRNPKSTHGASDIANLTYNEKAGAEKKISVGPHLKPLKSSATTFTTDASTALAIPMGVNLAIYNNNTAVGAITMGQSAAEVATALAPGVCDSTGHVGIPCAPGQWTYLSTFDQTFIKTTASTLLVFIIDDDSSVK